MATLYIHIGTHKTGTSTIQNTLNLNLNNHLGIKRDLGVIGTIREFYQMMSMKEEERALTRKVADTINPFIRECLPLGMQKFLISFEGFSGNFNDGYRHSQTVASALQQVTDALHAIDDVKIIIYLRRQDDFVESIYNQTIKEGSSKTFGDYILTLDKEHFNWEKLLEHYAAVFGQENLIVKRYDKKHLPGTESLLKDFYAILGINDFQMPQGNSNLGLSKEAIEVARVVNGHLNAPRQKQELRALLEATNQKEVYEKYSLFETEAARRAFLKQYQESNRTVAATYFGETDLFDNDFGNYRYEPYRGLSNEAVLVTLMKILIHQNITWSGVLQKNTKVIGDIVSILQK